MMSANNNNNDDSNKPKEQGVQEPAAATSISSTAQARSSAAWDNQYAKLLEFYQQHHHTNIPRKGNYTSLAKWLTKQRSNQASLSPIQLEKLNAVEFEWLSKKEKDNAAWKERFQRLEHYKEQHGNTNVPQKYKADLELGTWVANQRRRYNQNSLRPDRKELLDTLNFNFLIKGGGRKTTTTTSNSKPTVYDEQWNRMFEKLVQFQQTHGHTNVAQNAEGDLGMWVSTQRRNYHGKTWIPHGKGIREDRKLKLESIGFEWDRSNSKIKKRKDGNNSGVGGDSPRTKKPNTKETPAIGQEEGVNVQALVEAAAANQGGMGVDHETEAVVQEEVNNVVAQVQQQDAVVEAAAVAVEEDDDKLVPV